MNNLDGETLAYFAIVILFGGGFAFTGLYVLFYSVRKYLNQRQKKITFVQDFATIVDKNIELRKQRGRRRMMMYQPIFEYLVKGKVYRLTGFFPNSKDWSSSIPKNNEKRVIWINPDDPNDAFVEENSTENVLVIIIGLVFSIIGLLILFFMIYFYKPKNNNETTISEQANTLFIIMNEQV